MAPALQHHTPSLPFSDTSEISWSSQGLPAPGWIPKHPVHHEAADPQGSPCPVGSAAGAFHSSTTLPAASPVPTLLHVPGFFLLHSLRRRNRPGNKRWCQSGVISWQGIWEVAASVLNLSPPTSQRVLCHPHSQPATRFCSRLLAAGGIAGKHGLREDCFLVPTAAPS